MRPIIFLGASQSLPLFKRICELNNQPVLGVLDDDYAGNTADYEGTKVIGSELTYNFQNAKDFLYFVSSSVVPVNQRDRSKRLRLIELINQQNLECATIIHPSSEVYRSATINPGCYIGYNAAVTSNAVMMSHSQVHSHANLTHDCVLGINSALERLATIAGGVRIGNNVHIGMGTMLIKSGCTVGDNAVIHPGITVVRDVAENEVVSLAGGNTKRIYGDVIR